MSDFHGHDWMDDDDWLLSPQEREKHTAKNKARTAAESLRDKQEFMATTREWINDNMDKMSAEDLTFMYKMSAQVPELITFFKVFKELQNEG